jgi:hypothetical protein
MEELMVAARWRKGWRERGGSGLRGRERRMRPRNVQGLQLVREQRRWRRLRAVNSPVSDTGGKKGIGCERAAHNAALSGTGGKRRRRRRRRGRRRRRRRRRTQMGGAAHALKQRKNITETCINNTTS